MMNVFFTSDTHFGHGGILGHGRGEFRTIEEHDETLIDAFNSTVTKDDLVFHLGDFSLCNAKHTATVLTRLHFREMVHVLGNHDHSSTRKVFGNADNIRRAERLHTWKQDGYRVEMCHYPLEVWDRCHHGALHLHGHSHNHCNTRPRAKRLDVGVDSAKALLGAWRPFAWEEVLAIMAQRPELGFGDHHVRTL